MITKKSMQNLNALIFLSAVAEYKSKRKASEMLNTSIDTVNKYLVNLEHNLGIQLVINDSKGCRLTQRAKTIVGQVKNIRDALEYLDRQKPDNNSYKGEVSVCVPHNISINFPKCYEADFYNQFPDIKIISTTTSESPNFEEMGVDVAIVTKKPRPNCNFTIVCKRELKCGLFASDNYLNKYGYPKDLEDLKTNHRLVHVYNDYEGFYKIDKIVESANIIRFISNSGTCISSVIKNGVGIGVLPLHYKNEGFVFLDNIDFRGEVPFYLLVNNKTKELPRVRVVAEHYCRALDRPVPPNI